MPVNSQWHLRVRINNTTDFKEYVGFFTDVSDCTLVCAVPHKGSSSVFSTSCDGTILPPTHCHLMCTTPVALSIYKFKQLLMRIGFLGKVRNDKLGSRDYACSVATNPSDAFGYFLWEYCRSDGTITLPETYYSTIELTPAITKIALEHYKAKAKQFRRKQHKPGTVRLDILQSFFARYATGCTDSVKRVTLLYTQSLRENNLKLSRFIQEQDILTIWSHNAPDRHKHLAVEFAHSISEKYNIPE